MILKKCPMCEIYVGLIITPNEEKALERYYQKEDLIQNLFPNMPKQKREFIKSGYCPRCQNLLFDDNYIEDESWVI